MEDCFDVAVLQRAFVYDILATLIVFILSVITRNSSCYDPYWSVAPVPIAVYYVFSCQHGNRYRQAIVVGLVTVWGVRLTYNWAIGYFGKVGATAQHKEDWRYVLLQKYLGIFYWPVGSLLSIHLMPTVVVFLGCISIHVAVYSSSPLSWVDVMGAGVTALAILIEAVADEQMREYLRSRKSSTQVIRSGLWKYSRHPNYFGEILFWTGLFLIAVGCCPHQWWLTVLGPVAIVILFLSASIPIMESQQRTSKPEYSQYQRTTSVLVPWFTS